MSGPVLLERLHPPGDPAPVPELLGRLRFRERAGDERPFTYLNMVSTVDGRAAFDGRAAALGDEADLAVLLELRALADAVLVGTGTLRAEGYDELVRAPERRARRTAAGQPETPLAVAVSRGFDLPWDAGLFAAPNQPVLVYAGAPGRVPPSVAAPVEVVRLDDPGPAAMAADLRRRGIRALLCEGGPTLNRALIAAGLVDELFLTVSPLVTGDEAEPTIVAGGRLPEARPLALEWILRYGHELFLRYAVGRD